MQTSLTSRALNDHPFSLFQRYPQVLIANTDFLGHSVRSRTDSENVQFARGCVPREIPPRAPLRARRNRHRWNIPAFLDGNKKLQRAWMLD